jgi:hypothetical protein
MMMVVAASHTNINETKYNTSLSPSTPFDTDVKWVKKLSEAIISTTSMGAQPLNIFRTMGKPLRINMKQMTTPRMKAITWLLLKADVQDPIARKPPAISQLPQ